MKCGLSMTQATRSYIEELKRDIRREELRIDALGKAMDALTRDSFSTDNRKTQMHLANEVQFGTVCLLEAQDKLAEAEKRRLTVASADNEDVVRAIKAALLEHGQLTLNDMGDLLTRKKTSAEESE